MAQHQIEATAENGTARIRLAGEFDLGCARQIRTVLADHAAAEGVTRVELDLEAVTFMDSTGLGVLIGAEQRARAAGQELDVVAASNVVRRVLELTGVAARFFPDLRGEQPTVNG